MGDAAHLLLKRFFAHFCPRVVSSKLSLPVCLNLEGNAAHFRPVFFWLILNSKVGGVTAHCLSEFGEVLPFVFTHIYISLILCTTQGIAAHFCPRIS